MTNLRRSKSRAVALLLCALLANTAAIAQGGDQGGIGASARYASHVAQISTLMGTRNPAVAAAK